MKSWFFEKLSKIDKHLAKWTIKERERERRDNTISGISQEILTIGLADIKRAIIKK